ncbi:MAG: RagB/SusD family nutrient uptake outer membrane protein [Draconibacterium sp.]|nr:RagB/SusD family nutrient uptake outer membrane protein [Draconibacterium sp.]
MNLRRFNRFLFRLLLVLGILSACRQEFLDLRPKGTMNEYILADEKGINILLIGAYSMLDGVSDQFAWEAASSNWLWGDIRGMVANIGSDAGDASRIHAFKCYNEKADNPWLNIKWRSIYEAISRCNSTIYVTKLALKVENISKEKAEMILRQARVLRGWYHFEAWRMWQKIPYIDENTDPNNISNRIDVRDKIVDDLSEGTLLPGNMKEIGRFNSTVSKVLLAKALMQMYHDYAQAAQLLLSVKNNGTKPNGQPIGLAATYGEIFDIEHRNGIEAVYTVQYSVNDGSGGYNGGWGEVLNFPYKGGGGSPGGCCGFFQPTQEFVNSFRTDASGLPMLDHSYNLPENSDFHDQGVKAAAIWESTKPYRQNEVCTFYHPMEPYVDYSFVSKVDGNINNSPEISPEAWHLKWKEDHTKTVDPRLDWSVGRRGIPYWDWGIHTGSDWIRDQDFAGPYSTKKQVYKKSQEGIYTEVSGWTSGWTANGYRLIRYADVLLLLAECQIETGDLSGALENINAVRIRASNPDGFVKENDGKTPAANYLISTYPSFPDVDYARKALYMERKLELGMEGHRFFDLNRWGLTLDELERILDYEKTTPWGDPMYFCSDLGPEDLTYPIPQQQIDLSHGKLIQNRKNSD